MKPHYLTTNGTKLVTGSWYPVIYYDQEQGIHIEDILQYDSGEDYVYFFSIHDSFEISYESDELVFVGESIKKEAWQIQKTP